MTIKYIFGIEALRINAQLRTEGYELVDAKPGSYLYKNHFNDAELVLVLIK